MKRAVKALLMTILLGPYTIFSVAFFLSIILLVAGILIPSLRNPSIFYYGLLSFSAILIGRIFWIQIRQ